MTEVISPPLCNATLQFTGKDDFGIPRHVFVAECDVHNDAVKGICGIRMGCVSAVASKWLAHRDVQPNIRQEK